MELSELPEQALGLLRRWQYDRIIEKHEGPESWESTLRWAEPQPVELAGRWVLLPLPPDRYPNITVLRSYASPDGNSVTMFLKDMSLEEYYGRDDAMFWAGFFGAFERLPGSELFPAVVYHEWFIVENPTA